jgi:hypothetical protein
MTDHCADVRDLLHAFWDSDWPRCMARYADGAVYEDPLLPEAVHGKQGILGILKYCHSWGTYRGEILSVFSTDRFATAELRIRGRVTSTPAGMPPSVVGKEFDFAECDVFEFDATGLVVRESIYADVYSFMQQMGLLPAPEAPETNPRDSSRQSRGDPDLVAPSR